MNDTHRILFELLKQFNEICREHGIEYFLTGGSALGAIRHKGFIPWDDDIDIGITRHMWDIARPVLCEELPEGLVLVDNINYPAYRNPIARIVDTRTSRINKGALTDGCPKGQFLELFIHDSVPEKQMDTHKHDFLLYCELMSPYNTILQEKIRLKGGLRDDELKIADEYLQITGGNNGHVPDGLLAELEQKISRYGREDSDYMLLGWGVNACYYPIENFDSIRYEMFDGLEVPVPVRACENLRIDYGYFWTDYPPQKSRTAPHSVAGQPGISEAEYMKIIREHLDADEFNRSRLELKKLNLESVKYRIERDLKMFEIKMRHAQTVEKQFRDLKAAYSQGRYAEIAETFRQYTELKKRSHNYTMHDDISMESRRYLTSALVMLGRIPEAEAVMEIERNLHCGPDAVSEEQDLIHLAKASTCFYDGFYSEAEDHLEKIRAEWHGSPAFRKTRARLKLAEGIADQDALRLHEEFDDAETAKIKADALMLQGSTSEAENLYEQVLKSGTNGMDILDIRSNRNNKK